MGYVLTLKQKIRNPSPIMCKIVGGNPFYLIKVEVRYTLLPPLRTGTIKDALGSPGESLTSQRNDRWTGSETVTRVKLHPVAVPFPFHLSFLIPSERCFQSSPCETGPNRKFKSSRFGRGLNCNPLIRGDRLPR